VAEKLIFTEVTSIEHMIMYHGGHSVHEKVANSTTKGWEL